MATLNYSGLPAGATIILQDNLYIVQRGTVQHGLIVRVLQVEKTGQISVRGLRDSRYAILFQDPNLVQHAVFAVDVGDPSQFRRRLIHRIPPAVILQAAVAEDDRIELSWCLSPEGFEAQRYSGWARKECEAKWAEVGAAQQPQARMLALSGLAPDTNYDVRVRAENQEGRSRGYSNVRLVRTNPSTNENTNLVHGGSFEHAVWSQE